MQFQVSGDQCRAYSEQDVKAQKAEGDNVCWHVLRSQCVHDFKYELPGQDSIDDKIAEAGRGKQQLCCYVT